MGNETIGDAIERREHVEEGALFAWVAPYVEATAPDTPPIIMAVWLLTNPNRQREQREFDAWKVLKSSPDWSVIGPELVEALKEVHKFFTDPHNSRFAYRSAFRDYITEVLSRAQALKERVG